MGAPDTTLHVKGPTPPATERVAEYGAPVLPAGKEVVVICGLPTMVMLRFAVAVLRTLSVTFTVKLDVPIAVGTPLIVPVVDNKTPAGRVPEAIDQL